MIKLTISGDGFSLTFQRNGDLPDLRKLGTYAKETIDQQLPRVLPGFAHPGAAPAAGAVSSPNPPPPQQAELVDVRQQVQQHNSKRNKGRR